jgi:hypothetical protein
MVKVGEMAGIRGEIEPRSFPPVKYNPHIHH